MKYNKTVLRRAARLGVIAAALACLTLCSAPLAVHAQDDSLPTQHVSVNLSNGSLRSAMDILFKSAGLNYTIDPSINQKVTASLKGPFNVVFRALLRSTTPPLQYTVDNGVYKISPASIDTSSPGGTGAASTVPGAVSGSVPGAVNGSTGVGVGTQYASSGSETMQAVPIYLNYINGTLLNFVVGPVIDILPQYYLTAGSTGGGRGGGLGGGLGGGIGGGLGGGGLGGGIGGAGGLGGGGGFGGGTGGFGGGIGGAGGGFGGGI